MMAESEKPGFHERVAQLAALAFRKLVGLVEGTLTIGLFGLQGGIPEPGPFFEGQLRLLDAHALVLHACGAPADLVHAGRERTSAVCAALDRLRRALREPDVSMLGLEGPVRDLFDALDAVAALRSLDAGPSEKTRAIITQVMRSLAAEPAARAG